MSYDPNVLTDAPCFSDPGARFLVITPHPDDETLGCGGFLLAHPGQCDVLCLNSSGFGTDGPSAAANADVRIAEFRETMRAAGVPEDRIHITRLFGKPPLYRAMRAALGEAEAFLRRVADRPYTCVFMPHPGDGHREHRYLTNRLLKRLCLRLRRRLSPRIAFYEVWMPMGGRYAVNALQLMDREALDAKLALMARYRSQLVGNPVDYLGKIKGLNIYRGTHCFAYYAAEAFHVTAFWRWFFLTGFCHNNPYRRRFLRL